MNTTADKKEHVLSERENAALAMLDYALAHNYQGALRAAAVLGVADHLVDGPKQVDELASKVGADAIKLNRILRLLASRGVFRDVGGRQYELTEKAQFLRTDLPDSLRAAVLWLTDEPAVRPVMNVVDSLRGDGPFEKIFGAGFFDYWAKTEPFFGDFDSGMCSYSYLEGSVVTRAYDFPPNSTVVDVGGGFGLTLYHVLKANPTLHGILFDQQHVLDKTRLKELGDDSRYDLVAGNFFETCPKGDLYLLKYVLHDWGDENALKILKTCRKAMPAHAKVLIMDPLIPAGDSWSTSKLVDIYMMALTDHGKGKERTADEYRELLSAAGLRLNRIIDTGAFVPIVEAVAA